MTYRIYRNVHINMFTNFVRDAYSYFPNSDPLYTSALQKALKPFHAKYCLNIYYDNHAEDHPSNGPYIEFKDERYYSMFVLRYS